MLSLIFGSKKNLNYASKHASIDEKRREIFAEIFYLNKY
jgi:hypothetical protein